MIEGANWACAVHTPKSTPLQRLATAIEQAESRMPRPTTRVVVRSEIAVELGVTGSIEVVGQDGINADVYLFPIPEQ